MALSGLALGLLLACGTGCTIGGVHALPPLDAGLATIDHDGDPGDGGACTPGEDGDGDGVPDCDEVADGDPFTDPALFNGLTAMIGDRPEWSGTCGNLDDYAEMISHFAASTHVMDCWAGWEFDTSADAYSDPSYGFQPGWAEAAPNERFSLRFTGRIRLAEAGTHCFSVDIGATGTDLIGGKNGCGQIYLNAGSGAGQVGTWLAETGYEAASVDARVGCVELPAGDYTFDIVFWYFNVFEQAKLQVRRCTSASGACTPDQPLATEDLHAVP